MHLLLFSRSFVDDEQYESFSISSSCTYRLTKEFFPTGEQRAFSNSVSLDAWQRFIDISLSWNTVTSGRGRWACDASNSVALSKDRSIPFLLLLYGVRVFCCESSMKNGASFRTLNSTKSPACRTISIGGGASACP